ARSPGRVPAPGRHRRGAVRAVRAGPRGVRGVIGRGRRRAVVLAATAGLAIAPSAFAQMGPSGFGGPGGMQPPPAPGQGAEKEEGPAEEAPEENRPSDLEPLSGYAEQGRRRMQIFELDGYLRLRSDYMHQFFLGQGYYAAANTNIPNVNYGLPPFPVPLDCPRPNSMMVVSTIPSNCGSKNIGGANLRF